MPHQLNMLCQTQVWHPGGHAVRCFLHHRSTQYPFGTLKATTILEAVIIASQTPYYVKQEWSFSLQNNTRMSHWICMITCNGSRRLWWRYFSAPFPFKHFNNTLIANRRIPKCGSIDTFVCVVSSGTRSSILLWVQSTEENNMPKEEVEQNTTSSIIWIETDIA